MNIEKFQNATSFGEYYTILDSSTNFWLSPSISIIAFILTLILTSSYERKSSLVLPFLVSLIVNVFTIAIENGVVNNISLMLIIIQIFGLIYASASKTGEGYI